jgi:redox-sensing transcriptional repressor
VSAVWAIITQVYGPGGFLLQQTPQRKRQYSFPGSIYLQKILSTRTFVVFYPGLYYTNSGGVTMLIDRDGISKHTIHRLALYHSVLKMMQEAGRDLCISGELGRRTGISSHLIRRDFAYFGEFGIKGVGYKIDYLLQRIEKILGYNTTWNTVLVGLGVPVSYPSLLAAIKILAVIDLNEQNHRVFIPDLGLSVEAIDNIRDIIDSRRISIGIIAVPPPYVQEVADQLIKSGIKGIVNLSSAPIFAPESIVITHLNMASLLSQLTFSLSRPPEEDRRVR